MDPIRQIMYHPLNVVQKPKRWCTVCRNDAQGALALRGQQAPLRLWIRPSLWMTTPLDLNPDVSSLIVEAFMREGDALSIRRFALVSRACAASVSATLHATCAKLRRLSARVAQAQRSLFLCCDSERREEEQHQPWSGLDAHGSPWPEEEQDLERPLGDADDHDYDAVARMDALRNEFRDFMKRVGIPGCRRGYLAAYPQTTQFHDNRSLLGHLSDGCELCGYIDAYMQDSACGPVMLFACRRCRSKGGVELSLRAVKGDGAHRARHFVATVEARETEANNYARALLSKHAAQRRRMVTKRPHMLGPTNISKRVHVIDSNASLIACYDQSRWSNGYAPWTMVLWHRLPATLPQEFTFSAMMGVRDSDLVREEALRDAQRRTSVRRRGAGRRSLLAKLFKEHAQARKNVWMVARKGTFAGWVHAIDLCTTARAFEARWMFRTDQSGLSSNDWRMAAYRLLDLDRDALDAAVRRVSAVAHVLRVVGGVGQSHNPSTRHVLLQLLGNFPLEFLEGPVASIAALAHMLLNAPLSLSMDKETSGLVTIRIRYFLDGPFMGKTLSLQSHFSGFTVSKVLKVLGRSGNERELTHVMVAELERRANSEDCLSSPSWKKTRAVIYGLPACWPLWITDGAEAEAAHAKWLAYPNPNQGTA